MARGGSGPGGHNNHLTSTDATPAELSKYSNYAMNVFSISAPDLHDDKQVEAAIIKYFKYCDMHGIRPGNMGLYAVLGMSKQEVSNLLSGRDKNKASSATCAIIKKAKFAMAAFREGLAMDGKINPVTYIFMGKNYDGLEDNARLEVTTDRQDAPQLTQAEIQKRIPVYSDVDVDADSSE